ncbi:MAG TPA: presqualene diphosphate synthase HpnD [Casimicrobiaceae bacterium]|jgi:phytoene synthase
MSGLSEGRLAPVPRSASGSSFYAAMRILPAQKRRAMFEIYDFCRSVDDIADGDGDRRARLDQLERWRSAIDAVFDGAPPTGLRGLAQAVTEFHLRREDFLAIIDGMEMDACADISCPDSATLDLYCDRVASAAGRLSVRVFGLPRADGMLLAFHLGRALQLTNILRDLDEDAAKGRLYLPSESLQAAGIAVVEPAQVLAHPALGHACATVVARARHHFAGANEVLSRYPLRIVRSPVLMARVYQNILGRLARRGFAAPRCRVRVGRLGLLWILTRHGLI